MKTLGQKVTEFRAVKEWTTTRMAKEVGTTRQNIEHLERRGDIVPGYIKALARVMGASTDELLDRSAELSAPAPANGDDRLRLQAEQFATLLRAVPADLQLEAYTEATNVLLGFVLGTREATQPPRPPAPAERPKA